MPDFTLKPTFPIASVIDAAQRNNQLQQQAQQYGQQSLVSGLQSIGQVGQSLYDQKLKMAQALAQSHVFAAAHPELMAPQQTTTQAPVMRNQTAVFDPSTGGVTPNTQLSGVATSAPQTTTSAPLLNQGSLQTAFLGLEPKDLLNSLVQGQAAKTAQGELALNQKIEPQKIAIEGRKATAEEENNALLRQLQLKMGIATMANNAQERTQAAENAKAEEAKAILAAGSPLNPFNPVTFAQKKAAAQTLAGQGSTFSLPTVGQTVTHPSGVTIKRIK